IVLAVVLAGGVGWVWNDRNVRRQNTERTVEEALGESNRSQAASNIPQALAMARRAQAALAGGGADAPLKQRVLDRVADLELAQRLESIDDELARSYDFKQGFSELNWESFIKTRFRLYAEAFRGRGIDVETMPVEEAAERIRATTIATELAAALDA